jgi:hypothetical protein
MAGAMQDTQNGRKMVHYFNEYTFPCPYKDTDVSPKKAFREANELLDLLNSRSPNFARAHTHRQARALWEPLRSELPCRMHML